MRNIFVFLLLLTLIYLITSTINSTNNKNTDKYKPGNSLQEVQEWNWNTFLGSSSEDRGRSVAVNNSGSVYIAGYSAETWGTPVRAHSGWIDVFVAKLNSSGVLEWNTFLGGSVYDDYGKSISIDASGNIYIVGESDATWGSPVNEYAGGNWDVFAAKLNSNGVLEWNTFMGSSDTDYGESINVDVNGNVFITGWSQASWNSPVNAHNGKKDGFIAKLNGSGVLEWVTFVGSSADDEGNCLVLDGSGNIYIAGMSRGTWGSPIIAYSGGRDGFAVKLNSSGIIQWNTFMGSSYTDFCESITVDDYNNLYITGWSDATWGSPINDFMGNVGSDEGFVVKLNNSGIIQWSTFMGSSTNDGGNCITVDGSGNVLIAGESKATWGLPLNAFSGDGYEDGFVAMLNSNGILKWNTFMGSSSWDFSKSIAVDNNGNAYVGGTSYTNSWGSPVIPHNGWGYDAFIVKFNYSSILDLELKLNIPSEFKLSQNYPNPFNPSTTISYSIPNQSNVTLKVFDVLGREINTLVNKEQPQGNYEVEFDASNLTSGIYFYRIQAGDFVESKKMVLMK